jgi:predicted dehydrogenase
VVADVSQDLAREGKRTAWLRRHTDNWKDVVADPNVDVVDIATPNGFHYEVAKAALEHGNGSYQSGYNPNEIDT